MKIEKLRSKLKKVFNRVMGVLLPVSTLLVSCDTNALVVHAEESNVFIAEAVQDKTGSREYIEKSELKVAIPDGAELCTVVVPLSGSNGEESVHIGDNLQFYIIKNGSVKMLYESGASYSYTIVATIEGNVRTTDRTSIFRNMPYKMFQNDVQYYPTTFGVSGKCKVFSSYDELKKYASTGTGEYDIIKPAELEKGWYLKNVNGYVTADDSPSSEAGTDATYIHFTWDTDNLQEGDLIEIKTHSYYKKIGGEKLSGFHDFITYSDGVSATSGEYSFSQYLPAKAWFNSLENKPLVFKEYDTTDYYIRPVRMGSSGVEKYGGWIHIGMGKRTTPTSSPWADPDNSGDYGDFNEDGDWITDEETTENEGGRHGWLQDGTVLTPEDKTNPFTGTNLAGMFSYFFDFMKGIPSLLGDLPALVSSIIGFLPVQIIGFIGLGILVAIILRIVGR